MASWRERREQWIESREEAQNNASAAAAEAGERRPATAWPFLIAVAIVVLVLGAVVIASRVSPAENNVTQAQLLTDSISDFVRAQNEGDADLLRRATCEAQVARLIPGSDADYSSARADDVAENGKMEVDGVPTGYEVNGDRGLVTVTTRFDETDVTSTEQWRFVRVDENWMVCNV